MPLGLKSSRPSTRFGALDSRGLKSFVCPNSRVGDGLIVTCANATEAVAATRTAHKNSFIGYVDLRDGRGNRFLKISLRATSMGQGSKGFGKPPASVRCSMFL